MILQMAINCFEEVPCQVYKLGFINIFFYEIVRAWLSYALRNRTTLASKIRKRF